MEKERSAYTPELHHEALVANHILTNLIIDKDGNHIPFNALVSDQAVVQLIGRIADHVYIPTPEDIIDGARKMYTPSATEEYFIHHEDLKRPKDYFYMTASQGETRTTIGVPGVNWLTIGRQKNEHVYSGKLVIFRCSDYGALDASIKVSEQVKRIVKLDGKNAKEQVWVRDLPRDNSLQDLYADTWFDVLEDGDEIYLGSRDTRKDIIKITMGGSGEEDMLITIAHSSLSVEVSEKYAQL